MTDTCIIAGALVDAKNVGVHKSLRLIIDVPQEQAMDVIAKLGWPTQAAPIPVAIARLDLNKTKEVPSEDSEQPTSPTPASKSARAPNRYAMRAAIMGNDPQFWNYLRDVHNIAIFSWPDDKDKRELAADFIRKKCDVKSRADIQSSTSAATMFDLLETDYTLYRDADKFLEVALDPAR